MNLFQLGDFRSNSGRLLPWKIECDALSDRDIDALAFMLMEVLPYFSEVEGVPTGGIRLAKALEAYRSTHGGLLIVDDVLTTGSSMERHRNGRDAYGAVLFARGKCPKWVLPLFRMPRRFDA